IRAKAPWRRRPNRCRAPASGAPHSIVRPFVHRLIASYDIYVLPFATQVKHTMMPSPAKNLAFELEVIFCVQGVISPLLANIYLHHVYDQWAHQWRQRCATGDVIVVRYADDSIVGFEHRHEAEQFLADLKA